MKSKSMREISVSVAALAAFVWLAGAAPGWGDVKTWNNSAGNWIWDVGTSANWSSLNWNDGDDARFLNIATGAVTIAASGVSINSMQFPNSTAGFTFSGGDITGPGALTVGYTDNTVGFSNATLTFAGGTFLNRAVIIYAPTTAGAHTFGLGTITMTTSPDSGGRFRYQPTDSSASLSNNIVVQDNRPLGSPVGFPQLTGLYNTTLIPGSGFTGSVTLDGNVQLNGQNVFGTTFTLTDDRVIKLGTGTSTGAQTVFNGMVDGGGTYSVTITGNGFNYPTFQGASAATLAGNGQWDVKDVIFDDTGAGVSRAAFLVPNSATFFSTLRANGGKVIVHQGYLESTRTTSWGGVDTLAGTYNINAADYQVDADWGQIRSTEIYIYGTGSVGGGGTLTANTVYVGTDGTTPSEGTLAPGAGIGTLHVDADLVLGSAAVLQFDFDGTTCDLIAVDGDLTLGGILNVTGDVVLDQVYTLFTYTGDVAGSFLDITGVQAPRKIITIGGNQVTFKAVPEPATLGLLSAAVVGMLLRRRQR